MTPSFTTTVFECCDCCCCKCLDNGIHLFIFFRPSVYPFIYPFFFPIIDLSRLPKVVCWQWSNIYYYLFCVSIHSRNRSNDTEYLTIFRGRCCRCCWSDLRHLSLRLLCNRSIERKKKRSQKRKEQEREQQHLKKNSRVQSLFSTSSFGQFSRQPNSSSSWNAGNETATAAEEKCGNFIASTLDTLDTIYYHHQKMLTVKNAHPGPGTLLLTSNS